MERSENDVKSLNSRFRMVCGATRLYMLGVIDEDECDRLLGRVDALGG